MSYPKSVTFTQARKFIAELATSSPVDAISLPLNQVVGRLLQEDVAAAIDVPAWDCSRVDGYAFAMSSMRQSEHEKLPVKDAIHAGTDATDVSSLKYAHPIMTGAMLPVGADSIVMKEHATVTSDHDLKLNQRVEKGAYIRRKGDDLKVGQLVIKKGRRLRPEDVGLLASVGVAKVKVNAMPKVLLILTGDELVSPGNDCEPGQIYDANSFMLRDLLLQMGCEVVAVKRLKDNRKHVSQVFKKLKDKPIDVVISVGGVSMGDKDYIPSVLSEEGRIVFHKTGIKPGFPMLFGQLGQAMYFGLPGNPVSAYTTLCQFIWPALRVMAGEAEMGNLNWRGKITHDVSKSHFRREFMRGYYVQSFDGSIDVTVCGAQQSSRIKSLTEANCFIVLDESQQDVVSGELVRIQPFHQFNVMS
ncbi:gephyrin-like molybdotransferase Glp [Marinicella rhabdoformis]|uniref:molybdopterin molybdotransferase MoeA n=1 Tax=Marinicella rhabdoformis TaxID=2580566 RepID=UPI0015D04B60|nr:gephyrin-like molybdotransferase Glp [Marinicella rhabdoformis]